MNDNFDIKLQNAKLLLERYYSGETSQHQTSLLIGLLHELIEENREHAGSLADELRIILEIEGIGAENIAVPADLNRRIEDALPKRRGWRRRISVAVTSAAAAAVVVFGTWKAVDYAGKDARFADTPKAATATIAPSETESDKESGELIMTLPQPDRIAASKKAASPKPSAVIKNVETFREGATRGNIREVTDPEEAAMIIDRVLVKMMKTVNTAEAACDEPQIVIDNMNHTIAKATL